MLERAWRPVRCTSTGTAGCPWEQQSLGALWASCCSSCCWFHSWDARDKGKSRPASLCVTQQRHSEQQRRPQPTAPRDSSDSLLLISWDYILAFLHRMPFDMAQGKKKTILDFNAWLFLYFEIFSGGLFNKCACLKRRLQEDCAHIKKFLKTKSWKRDDVKELFSLPFKLQLVPLWNISY